MMPDVRFDLQLICLWSIQLKELEINNSSVLKTMLDDYLSEDLEL